MSPSDYTEYLKQLNKATAAFTSMNQSLAQYQAEIKKIQAELLEAQQSRPFSGSGNPTAENFDIIAYFGMWCMHCVIWFVGSFVLYALQ